MDSSCRLFFHREKLFFSISLSIIAFDWAETGGDSPPPLPPPPNIDCVRW
jgi:hypothetical protein